VDVSVVVDPLQELANETLVALVARTDEEVDLRVHPRCELAPWDGDAVGVLLRLEPLFLGHAPHFRSVLVDAGEKERVRATLALVADKQVTDRRCISVTDGRRRV